MNINEWNSTDLITAQTVAHEIGHNLGMEHDFIESLGAGNPRTDSNRQSCAGFLMDYVRNPTQWSGCSRDDFTKYYNQNQPFCMAARDSAAIDQDCKDDWGFEVCDAWKEYCNEAGMKKYCKKSCNICTANPCNDNSWWCSYITDSCRKDSEWGFFVKTNCPKSCGQC